MSPTGRRSLPADSSWKGTPTAGARPGIAVRSFSLGADALAGARHQLRGNNLVLHEFAHQLDMQNGRLADGVPPMESTEQYRRWQEVTDAEYDRLVFDCRHGRPTLLDCYGTTNRAEFFAVTTECFFERPQEMIRRHPELYAVFREYYRQDPAAREADA